jgi:Holliday junction resolvasome RuvABC endonuclease subunit
MKKSPASSKLSSAKKPAPKKTATAAKAPAKATAAKAAPKKKAPSKKLTRKPIIVPANFRMLAFDQSSKATGWSIIDYIDGQVFLRQFGIINIVKDENKKELEFLDRVPLICEKVQILIDASKPHVIALEEPFVGRNMKTADRLFKSFGAIVAIAAINQIALVSCTPMEAKEYVLRGLKWARAAEDSKVLVKRVLQEQFGVTFTSQSAAVCDDSDSVAVGLTCIFKKVFK